MKLFKLFLLLSISIPVYAAPSFMGDWESGTVTGQGNTNWAMRQTVATDRFRLINDASRVGTYARVEVRPGDDPINAGTERSEVLGMQNADNSWLDENEDSGTQQYSFSVKFDSTWQAPVNTGQGAWAVFLQLHGSDVYHTNPAISFNATDKISLGTRVGDLATSGMKDYPLSNSSLNKGKWIDLILTIKFAKDNAGFINLLRRDEGQAIFTEVLNVTGIPTLQYSSLVDNGVVKDHYWKHGLYRNNSNFTSVLYLDGMTREAVGSIAPIPAPPPVVYLPDVVITSLSYYRGIFTCTVKNQGNTATPANALIGVAYYVDGIKRTWGAKTGPLAAGRSVTIGTNGAVYKIPYPSYTHKVGAYVDDVNRFTESNESNNAL